MTASGEGSQSLGNNMTELVIHSTNLPEAAIVAIGNQLGRSPDSRRGSSARWSHVAATPELQAIAEAHRVDIAFVPANRRRADFRLLVMDMDSTLITIECIDEIADRIATALFGDESADDLTGRARRAGRERVRCSAGRRVGGAGIAAAA